MAILNLFKFVKDFKDVSAGEVIFREGDAGDSMYVVIDGEVDVVTANNLLETVTSGSVIGEMALIDQEPRSATATAKTDCRLVEVDQRRFSFMVQETPFFALEIMKVMADRLRRAHNQG